MREEILRLFWLVRAADVTGVSGTGIVAEGVEFSDGTVVLRWLKREPGEWNSWADTPQPTTVIHEDLSSVFVLHGHDGKTTVAWEDPNLKGKN